MQESLSEGGSVPSGLDTPTFAPRKGVLLREYYVLVKWADGRRAKVGRFSRRPDAWRWIEQKSSGWLAEALTAEKPNLQN